MAELRLECQKYDYHIDEYKDLGPEETFIKFNRAIHLIQGEQMLQEAELWNPKRDEGKKTGSEMNADQQEEKESKKVRDTEILEECESEELFAEYDGNDRTQHEVNPCSPENASPR